MGIAFMSFMGIKLEDSKNSTEQVVSIEDNETELK